ncbi:MAG: hypothetical protein ACRDPG_00735 [Nocardioidaceae bacterium]
MPSIDIIDESFLVASREIARAALCDESRWRNWFPGLVLTAYEDRGLDGVRWRVAGDLVGTAEVWLQEHGDGTIAHIYFRAEPGRSRSSRQKTQKWARTQYVLPLKQRLFALKDELEAGREPGEPRVPQPLRVVSSPTTTTGARPPRGRRAGPTKG